jgi:prephenate dehydratase
MRCSVQGEPGGHGDSAAISLLGSSVKLVPLASFAKVFASVVAGKTDCGLIAIEDSLGGGVPGIIDLFLQCELSIAAELNYSVDEEAGVVVRYVLVQRKPALPSVFPMNTQFKTSVVFTTYHGQSGSLFKALSAFAVRGIDITKIESRIANSTVLSNATRKQPMWLQTPTNAIADTKTQTQQHLFYIDAAASVDDEAFVNALRQIREIAPTVWGRFTR